MLHACWQEKKITYRVIDLETDCVLSSGETVLQPNSLKQLGFVAFEPQGNRYYLLELVCEGQMYPNHYVSGSIPFDPVQYENFLKKANIL